MRSFLPLSHAVTVCGPVMGSEGRGRSHALDMGVCCRNIHTGCATCFCSKNTSRHGDTGAGLRRRSSSFPGSQAGRRVTLKGDTAGAHLGTQPAEAWVFDGQALAIRFLS